MKESPQREIKTKHVNGKSTHYLNSWLPALLKTKLYFVNLKAVIKTKKWPTVSPC